ncbi:MAG: hypothetical protein R3C99_06795 [Pirellulaceae bacterium]
MLLPAVSTSPLPEMIPLTTNVLPDASRLRSLPLVLISPLTVNVPEVLLNPPADPS